MKDVEMGSGMKGHTCTDRTQTPTSVARGERRLSSGENTAKIFVIFSVVSLFLTAAVLFLTHGEYWNRLFFHSSIDTGMDFFHSIEYVKGRVPYASFHTLYPPLANLLFYILFRLVPGWQHENWIEGFHGSIQMRQTEYDLRIWQPTALLYILYIVITAALLVFIIMQYLKKMRLRHPNLVCLAVLFSYGVLYNYERGNIMILAVICCLFYVLYYNSPNKLLSELALLALAFAAGIKLYPAVFGMLLLYEKQYKKAFRCVFYGILMLVLPCFAFHEGLGCLRLFYKELRSFTEFDASSIGFSFKGMLCTLVIAVKGANSALLGSRLFALVSTLGSMILSIICLICGFAFKKKWQKLLACCTAMLIFADQAMYATAFFLVPFLSMLRREHRLNAGNVIPFAALLISVVMLPIFDRPDFPVSYNKLRFQICLAVFLIYLALEACAGILQRKDANKGVIRVVAWVSVAAVLVCIAGVWLGPRIFRGSSITGLFASASDDASGRVLTVYYHFDDETEPSGEKTRIAYNKEGDAIPHYRLGFVKDGKTFTGWKAYRPSNRCWRVVDSEGNRFWSEAVARWCKYALYKDGAKFSNNYGSDTELHLYAQWAHTLFARVYYHTDVNSVPVETVSTVKPGAQIQLSSAEEAGVFMKGKRFTGWRVYRPSDGCWQVFDANGRKTWKKRAPKDGGYVLLSDRDTFREELKAGDEIHLFAQWEDATTFDVKYFEDDYAPEPSKLISQVSYGHPTLLRSVSELGFSKPGKEFAGWKVYRPDKRSWWVINTDSKADWKASVGEGESHNLIPDEFTVTRIIPAGASLYLYAQWKNTGTFTVYYHLNDESPADEQETVVERYRPTATLTWQELGFDQSGKRFVGWRAFSADENGWCVEDSDGNITWSEQRPEGGEYRYHLFDNGAEVSDLAEADGEVYFYAQWRDARESRASDEQETSGGTN